jgi:hypothetical protein
VLHQVGVLFDLYYDARKHKSKILIFVGWLMIGRSNRIWMAELFVGHRADWRTEMINSMAEEEGVTDMGK